MYEVVMSIRCRVNWYSEEEMISDEAERDAKAYVGVEIRCLLGAKL